jgi:hypothetical protein
MLVTCHGTIIKAPLLREGLNNSGVFDGNNLTGITSFGRYGCVSILVARGGLLGLAGSRGCAMRLWRFVVLLLGYVTCRNLFPHCFSVASAEPGSVELFLLVFPGWGMGVDFCGSFSSCSVSDSAHGFLSALYLSAYHMPMIRAPTMTMMQTPATRLITSHSFRGQRNPPPTYLP